MLFYFNPRSREGSDYNRRHSGSGQGHFNPRSREGSDVSAVIDIFPVIYFNPRSREGSDPRCIYHATRRLGISIHAPARGATVKCLAEIWEQTFQSTLPRGERRYFACSAYPSSTFQSTLPRGERRGTTAHLQQRHGRFQSTLPRGERLPNTHTIPIVSYFNPRSREGSDLLPFGSSPLLCDISIHAPARGATMYRGSTISIHRDFNPRSREGSDLLVWLDGKDTDDFNPRSREGSDGTSPAAHTRLLHFNPRSREGSDKYVNGGDLGILISIHAPARGATFSHFLPFSLGAGFQSTLPRGERP